MLIESGHLLRRKVCNRVWKQAVKIASDRILAGFLEIFHSQRPGSNSSMEVQGPNRNMQIWTWWKEGNGTLRMW